MVASSYSPRPFSLHPTLFLTVRGLIHVPGDTSAGHAGCAVGLPTINHPGWGWSQENIPECLETALANGVGNFMVPRGPKASRACPLGQAPCPGKNTAAAGPEQGPPRAGPPDGSPVAQLWRLLLEVKVLGGGKRRGFSHCCPCCFSMKKNYRKVFL